MAATRLKNGPFKLGDQVAYAATGRLTYKVVGFLGAGRVKLQDSAGRFYSTNYKNLVRVN